MTDTRKAFQHPKIFSDFLTIYKIYYKKHEALPKMFRVTIGTEMMRELAQGIKYIVIANFKKNNGEDFIQSGKIVKELRSSIELLKSYVLIGWEMQVFSHGFYIELMNRMEEVSKQAASWNEWLDKQGRLKPEGAA